MYVGCTHIHPFALAGSVLFCQCGKLFLSLSAAVFPKKQKGKSIFCLAHADVRTAQGRGIFSSIPTSQKIQQARLNMRCVYILNFPRRRFSLSHSNTLNARVREKQGKWKSINALPRCCLCYAILLYFSPHRVARERSWFFLGIHVKSCSFHSPKKIWLLSNDSNILVCTEKLQPRRSLLFCSFCCCCRLESSSAMPMQAMKKTSKMNCAEYLTQHSERGFFVLINMHIYTCEVIQHTTECIAFDGGRSKTSDTKLPSWNDSSLCRSNSQN